MHRQELLQLLEEHSTCFMDEAAFVRRAIRFIVAYPECFERSTLPAHVTGSAWVIDHKRDCTLLLHHRKHEQWFQPGGHADGDGDIRRVALREASEETGLDPAHLQLVEDRIFDVDIHTVSVPGQPAHEHIDIRFLVEVDSRLTIPGNHESNAILWVPLHAVVEFNNSRSTYRMIEKTRRLRHAQEASASFLEPTVTGGCPDHFRVR